MSRRHISSAAVATARRYLSRPEEFWQGTPDRQVRKLRGMLRSATPAGERATDVIEEVLAIARLRTHHAPAPIYLPNIGSSGSHWLEAMLARATDVHACGEVYLPKSVHELLHAGSGADAEFFMHAVLALHTGRSGPDLVSGRFINSAHYGQVARVASLTSGALTVLLVRHPVDVVMSRTLRKAEYRDEVAPGLDDQAYLERNCTLVERFYRGALSERFDATVRYEDLLARPIQTLEGLISRLGLETSLAALEQAVEATSPDAVRIATERGEKAPTNLFLGDPVRVDPALKQAARQRLRACCESLEYPIEG